MIYSFLRSLISGQSEAIIDLVSAVTSSESWSFRRQSCLFKIKTIFKKQRSSQRFTKWRPRSNPYYFVLHFCLLWGFLSSWCVSSVRFSSARIVPTIRLLSETGEFFKFQIVTFILFEMEYSSSKRSLNIKEQNVLIGGSIALWLAYLLPDPAAMDSIPSIPEIFPEEIFWMLLRLINGPS